MIETLLEKLGSPRVDKELLEQLGDEASSDYLDRGIPLSESIIKIAQSRDFTPHQIQRVCEFANLKTFQELYKTSEDKTFQFDVADIKGLLNDLNSPETSVTKVAYTAPTTNDEDFSSIMDELFPEVELSKAADEEKPCDMVEGIPRNDVKKTMQRIELTKQSMSDEVNMMKLAAPDLEDEIYRVVKQSIMNRDLDHNEIYAAAIQRFPAQRDRVKEILNKVFSRLQKEHILDPTEQIKISAPTGKLLINDNHPFIRNVESRLDIDEKIASKQAEIDQTTKVIDFIRSKL